jgi:hypothetical protein
MGKEKFMNSKLIKIAAFIFFVIPSLCCAEIIKIGFTGEVYYLEDLHNLLGNNVQIGSAISGFYIYDSSTPRLPNMYYAYGEYKFSVAPFGISLTAGGFTFRTDPANVDFSIAIMNYVDVPEDRYTIISRNNLPLSNGVQLNTIEWMLDDCIVTHLPSSDLLPLDSDVSTWYTNEMSINGGGANCGDPFFGLGAHVTSTYLVPEPATLLLLGLGCLLIRKRK